MILGISIGQKTCRILGQVSHNLLYWKKKTSRRIYVVRWKTDKTAGNHPGQIIHGQNSGENGKECQAEGEAKVVNCKTETR